MMKSTVIVERPEDQRYWVVRASGGDFVSHFRQSGVVAIGHIDELLDFHMQADSYYPNLKLLRESIEKREVKKEVIGAKYRAHSHFNQVKTFIGEISIGDLIVTINKGSLSVGRVIGHPFIDTTPVRDYYDEKRSNYSDMSYRLRRAVQWGPVMSRSALPTAMKRSISARQTVFNVDTYWAALYHLLYPVFRNGDRVYVSARIKQKDAINSFSISQIFRILTELEVVARSYEAILDDPATDFDALFAQFRRAGDFDLKTVAEFMSPGSIWGYLGFSDKAGRRIFVAGLLYGAIFGIDVNDVSIGGVIDKDVRQKVIEYFLNRLKVNDVEEMKQRLNLDVPRHDTEPLEDQTHDAQPDERAFAMLEEFEADNA